MHRDSQSEDRLARWVREHGRAVRGYLFALVRDTHVAEDLTQDVFCRAWEARQRYQDQGHERAYLLKIADRLACDFARRAWRMRTVDDDAWHTLEPVADEPSAERQVEQAERERALFAALDELSEPQRRTLLLRYYGNLDYALIASQLGCGLNTALSHAHRGLARLRAMLEKTP